MKEYRVEAAFVTISSGKIALSDGQFSSREHALQKTKDKGVYLVTGKCGFKKGETFGYEGDAGLEKAGMIASLEVKSAEPEKPASGEPEKAEKAESEDASLFKKGGKK